MMGWCLKSDLVADQSAPGKVRQSVNQTDKAESKLERKVSAPSSCPLACHLLADVIDMAEKPNGVMATTVISCAKWARVIGMH